MSNSQPKRSWSPLEIGLVVGVVVLLCAAATMAVLLVGDFALWEAGQVNNAQGDPANIPPGAETAIASATDSAGQGASGRPTPTAQPEESQSITLNPAIGAPGATITVQGAGWPADSRIVIYLVPVNPPRYAINSAVADAAGNFTAEIIVPSDPRWLNESPVPVLAELADGGLSAQAQLNISSPASDGPALTPIPVSSQPQPTPTLAPPADGAAHLTVNAGALNVRRGPGTNYGILGVLHNNQQAEITGRNTDATWWQIKYPAAPGGLGWVSAAYATAENIGNVPVVNPPAPPPPPPPTPTPAPDIPITEWRGEYFNNPTLQGPPTLVVTMFGSALTGD
jgi:hypothetical protein